MTGIILGAVIVTTALFIANGYADMTHEINPWTEDEEDKNDNQRTT